MDVSCELWIDGMRVADDVAGHEAGNLTALDDLAIAWGRDTTVDQPEPSTCTITLSDPDVSTPAFSHLRLGALVDVYAAGVVPADTDDPVNIFRNRPLLLPEQSFYPASYSTSLDHVHLHNATDLTPISGVRRLPSGATAIVYSATSIAPQIEVRPAPASTDPDAWVQIPKITPTSTGWVIRVIWQAPVGIRVYFTAQGFISPSRGEVGADNIIDGYTVGVGTGQPATSQFAIRTGRYERWVGLGITPASPGPAGLTWAATSGQWSGAPASWLEQAILVHDIEVLAPGADIYRRVKVFSGTITDVDITPDPVNGEATFRVTAADVAAELANVVVGDQPWGKNTTSHRLGRIWYALLQADPTLARSLTTMVDPSVAGIQIAARDVDAQPAWALYADLAQSVGGVMWVQQHATRREPRLWLEDPSERAAVAAFAAVGDQVVIQPTVTEDRGVVRLSACDVLLDNLSWHQSVSDIVTTVSVTWLEAGVDDEGNPTSTERYVTVTDPDAVARWGRRRLSVSTELALADDAAELAERLLARFVRAHWRIAAATVDASLIEPAAGASLPLSMRADALFTLLDGTSRLGAGVVLLDLPAGAPEHPVSTTYLEGGVYTYIGGRWQLSLTLSPAVGVGQSASWAEADPTWRWDQFGRITWADAYGVAVPTGGL